MLYLLKENMIFIYNRHLEKSTTTMLAFLINYNSSVTTLNNEVISDIQYQLLWKY